MRLLTVGVGIALSLSVAVAGETKYEAKWESLDKRPTPEWFAGARFGVLIHWGVYSVPAWAPKGKYAAWYRDHMQDKKGPTWEYHVKTYGKEFKYRQFAPMLKAEKFKPDQWADLFARAGARYVVLTAKHRDGYCLWPSAQAKGWNSMEVGPKRDLLGDLAKAVRKRGLKMGLHYSLSEWDHPLYRSDVKRYVEEHMVPQFKDVVTRYAPSVILADGEGDHLDKVWKSEELLAWVFNKSPCREDVAVNDCWGKGCRGQHGGYYTSEYASHLEKLGPDHVWEENQGIGRSFGYNRNEGPDDYKTTQQLIRLLVDCVSRGGNLLLGVGPAADGTIPKIMQDRLLEMGKWLKINGESVHGAGPGPVRDLPWGRCTAKPGKLFLHVYKWPKGDLEVPGLSARVEDAWMLADPERTPLLLGASEGGALTVTVPRKAPDPIDSVVVLKIEGEARVAAAAPIRHTPGKPTTQAPDGTIALQARNAAVHGRTARYESGGGKDNIGYWTDAGDWVSWNFDVTKPGTFDVQITFACARGSGGSEYDAVVGDQRLSGTIKETGSWTNFITEKVGTMKLTKPGKYTLSVKPTKKPRSAVMNLKAITLRPAKK